MQGLALCEQYFFEVGLPRFRESLPGLVDRMAFGLVGDGSECYGFDDGISQDHDWGPGFCAWLSEADFAAHGREAARAYAGLPGAFGGYGPRQPSAWGDDRVGVFSIPAFYAKFLGRDRPPESLDDWLALPESFLAAATNGKVFLDPAGGFTGFREALLSFYPEDVRKKKIASRCMTAAQAGQYNLARAAARGAALALAHSRVKFCLDIASLVFLLNRRYAPFFKWVHQALAGLPILGAEAARILSEILAAADPRDMGRGVERLAGLVIAELRRQGLSDLDSPFLLDHGPRVAAGIRDPDLGARNIWVG